MKNHTKKQQTEFLKKATKIILDLGGKKEAYSCFEFKSSLGNLYIRPDGEGSIYSIFMRFETLDINEFFKVFSEHEQINRNTFKWNIHLTDMEDALQELEERLENLNYIAQKV